MQIQPPVNRIRQLREERQLSRADVASALDVDQSTVYRWEAGLTATVPDPKKHRLAQLLGVSVPALMGYENTAAA